jgi:hypothetical protein
MREVDTLNMVWLLFKKEFKKFPPPPPPPSPLLSLLCDETQIEIEKVYFILNCCFFVYNDYLSLD